MNDLQEINIGKKLQEWVEKNGETTIKEAFEIALDISTDASICHMYQVDKEHIASIQVQLAVQEALRKMDNDDETATTMTGLVDEWGTARIATTTDTILSLLTDPELMDAAFAGSLPDELLSTIKVINDLQSITKNN